MDVLLPPIILEDGWLDEINSSLLLSVEPDSLDLIINRFRRPVNIRFLAS